MASPQQKKINYLQNRFTPYFIITLFAAATAILRVFIIDKWIWWLHLLGFIVQVIVLISIWQLIKWLNRLLERNMPFGTGPLRRMMVQIGLTLLIVAPVLTILIILASPYFPEYVNKAFLAVSLMIPLMIIFLFNFSFYAGYFFTNWQASIEEKAKLEVQAAELERETFNLQYHQLKNQVNPHYLFNMLTSLDGLIHTNPDLASEFVKHMSKVYRYVLQHKESEVVTLEEELEFISHYIELLHIRYAAGLHIHHTISEAAADKGIVMVTLQMLIDNAIKHNIVQPNAPLKITIWDEGDYLHVHNNKQLRRQIETSNGQGLAQLKKLYGFITRRQIIIEDAEEHYTIKIPLL